MKKLEDVLYHYKATVFEVIDGDTIHGKIDWGKKMKTEPESIRLLGVNTPEIRSKDPVIKAAGLKAKAWVQERIKPGQEILIHSVRLDPEDNFTRILAYVWIIDENLDFDNLTVSTSLNMELIREGLGVPYEG